MNLIALVMPMMSFLVSHAAQAAPSQSAVPDFMVDVYHEGTTFGLVLTPPADHHFNIQAPYSAQVGAKNITLGAIQVQPTRMIFEKVVEKEGDLLPADTALVTAFLCDNAKTYCVKKTKSTNLMRTTARPVISNAPAVNPRNTAPSFKAPAKKATPKKDEHGFWSNAPAEAFAEAARARKPVLIDFYGIWCPPCNQFNESVFPSSEFQAAAKNFVLLKMDADRDASWELKSHFKIGGYPTVLVMKAPASASAEVSSLEEIDRIVGFFPTSVFVKKLNEVYAHRNESFEDRVLSQRESYVENLRKLIETKWEQKDFEAAQKYAEEGLKLQSEDLYFQLIPIQVKAKDQPGIVKEKATLTLIEALHEKRKTASVEALLRGQDLLVSNAEVLKPETVAKAVDLLNALTERVNPKTLIVDGYELSIADIDALKVDVASALKDEAAVKRARGQTIESYKKLIAGYGKKETRGLNLELAYWLWNDGQVDEAKKIYGGFIKKYPKEFTFYFAAAKMNLDLKNYAEAKAQAEKAVEYSYGDNHLRSMERLVRVLTAAGEPKIAVERGNALLAKTKDPKGYFVRTDRYITALKKAVEAAQTQLTASTHP